MVNVQIDILGQFEGELRDLAIETPGGGYVQEVIPSMLFVNEMNSVLKKEKKKTMIFQFFQFVNSFIGNETSKWKYH